MNGTEEDSKNIWIKFQNFYCSHTVISVLLLIFILIVIIISWIFTLSLNKGKTLPIILFILGYVWFGFILYCVYGGRKSCPNCKRFYCAKVQNIEELGREQRTEIQHHTQTNYDSKGREIGTARIPVSVTRTFVTRKYYVECKRCGCNWEDIKTDVS